MSQAKVDKYKEEKKNRGKVMKRKKRKQIAEVLVCAGLLGALVGYPLGRYAYKINLQQREAKKTIMASNYSYWAQTYWSEKYYGIIGIDYSSDDLATDLDATDTDAFMSQEEVLELLDEATSTDAE